MDERDRQLFSKLARRPLFTNGGVAREFPRQLGGLMGAQQPAGGEPFEDIIDEDQPVADPAEQERFIEMRGCQEAIANLINKIHGYIKLLEDKNGVRLIFREPVWRGLLLFIATHNPMFKGDPRSPEKTGSFLGMPTLATFDPKEDEVHVEHRDLPVLVLRSETLPRLAAYWSRHGGAQTK